MFSGSRFGRRFDPAAKTSATFFERHYRGVHHAIVIFGVSAFFGPFIYRYFTRPPLEDARLPFRSRVPDYKRIEEELDSKWMILMFLML